MDAIKKEERWYPIHPGTLSELIFKDVVDEDGKLIKRRNVPLKKKNKAKQKRDGYVMCEDVLQQVR